MLSHEEYMLMAFQVAPSSNCQRREIGAIFRVGLSTFIGVNKSALPCELCYRTRGECSAIHAEVNAILAAKEWATFPASELYLWAEIPCSACLSFIHQQTEGRCAKIHCLSVETYGTAHPPVLTNLDNIAKRITIAYELNITIKTYDMHNLLRMLED